jgi:hypothetical protein
MLRAGWLGEEDEGDNNYKNRSNQNLSIDWTGGK